MYKASASPFLARTAAGVAVTDEHTSTSGSSRNSSFGSLDEILAPTPIRKASHDLRFSASAAIPVPARKSKSLTHSCPTNPNLQMTQLDAANQELLQILSSRGDSEAAPPRNPVLATSPPSLRAPNPLIRNNQFNSQIGMTEHCALALLPSKRSQYASPMSRENSLVKQRSMSWPTPPMQTSGFLPPVDGTASNNAVGAH